MLLLDLRHLQINHSFNLGHVLRITQEGRKLRRIRIPPFIDFLLLEYFFQPFLELKKCLLHFVLEVFKILVRLSNLFFHHVDIRSDFASEGIGPLSYN